MTSPVPVTAKTAIYALEYLDEGEPAFWMRARLQRNSEKLEQLLQARAIAPPDAADLATLAGRVTALESRVSALEVPHGPWTNLTYATGWATVGGFRPVQYRKLRDGSTIEMRGVCTGPAAVSTIGTLPAGYRVSATPPAGTASQEIFDPGNDAALGRITMNPDGTIVRSVGSGYVTFSEIRFSTL